MRRAAALAAVAWVATVLAPVAAPAQPAPPRTTLRQLVTPSSRLEVQGRPLRFALHGLGRVRHAHRPVRLHRRRGRTLALRLAGGAPGVRRRPAATRRREPRRLDGDRAAARAAAHAHARRARRGGRAPCPAGDAPRSSAAATGSCRPTPIATRSRASAIAGRASLNCWSASPSIPGPGAVELVRHRRGHRALRRDLRLDRALLAGGQVPPRRHRRRGADAARRDARRRLAPVARHAWPPIRPSTSPTPTRWSS